MSTISSQEIISIIKGEIEDYDAHAGQVNETGSVIWVGDGIAIVYGIDHAMYGEIVIFENGVKGMVQDIRKNEIGCILFGKDTGITEGTKVTRTKKKAGVPVGAAFLGRVVNALGETMDGMGPAKEEDYLPVELPEGVKNFLQEKYAASEIVETDREHGQFEVDIIHDGVAKKVLFDNNGNWLSTSWEISPDTLPEAVKTAIQQAINDNYVGYEADDEPGMVETPDGNYYRIELEAEDGREVILKIREDGTLLK